MGLIINSVKLVHRSLVIGGEWVTYFTLIKWGLINKMFTASSVHSAIAEARVLPRAPVCALVNVCARSRKREERGCGPFYLIKRCPLGGEWGCWLSGQRKVPRTTQHALQPAQHKYTNTLRGERSAAHSRSSEGVYTFISENNEPWLFSTHSNTKQSISQDCLYSSLSVLCW